MDAVPAAAAAATGGGRGCRGGELGSVDGGPCAGGTAEGGGELAGSVETESEKYASFISSGSVTGLTGILLSMSKAPSSPNSMYWTHETYRSNNSVAILESSWHFN